MVERARLHGDLTGARRSGQPHPRGPHYPARRPAHENMKAVERIEVKISQNVGRRKSRRVSERRDSALPRSVIQAESDFLCNNQILSFIGEIPVWKLGGLVLPMSVIEAFPKRRLQLTGYGEPITAAVWVVCAIWFVFVPIVLHSSVLSLNNDYRLHANGTVASESEVKNYSCRAKSASVEFDVRYLTQDGTWHAQHVDVIPHLVRARQKACLHRALRSGLAGTYQHKLECPAFAESHDFAHRRSWDISGFDSMRVVVTGDQIRLRRKLAAIGAQPAPLEVKLVGRAATPRSRSAEISYAWTDASGRSLTGSTKFKDSQEPFWLDAAKTKMLAPVGPTVKRSYWTRL